MNNTPSLKMITRTAGLAYVVIILLAFMTVYLSDSQLIMSTNQIETNVQTYRLGIFSDLMMYILVMVLSWALYVILKPVNPNMALLALIFRFAESILGCITVLCSLIALSLLGDANYLKVFEQQQLQALAKVFLNIRPLLMDILLVIMGLGGIIFGFLFYQSRLLPRLLAGWGIFTYFTMLIYASLQITLTHPPAELMYAMYPGALFEVVIGAWLFVKGLNNNGLDEHKSSSGSDQSLQSTLAVN